MRETILDKTLPLDFLGDTVKRHFNQELVDNAGACLSFACAIHCLAMPLLIVVLPLVGLGFFVGESAEWVIILSAVALAIGSLT